MNAIRIVFYFFFVDPKGEVSLPVPQSNLVAIR